MEQGREGGGRGGGGREGGEEPEEGGGTARPARVEGQRRG